MKREVAALSRFFRGVCPILNRAILKLVQSFYFGLLHSILSFPGAFATALATGFLLVFIETPGRVFGFLECARQLFIRRRLLWQSKKRLE